MRLVVFARSTTNRRGTMSTSVARWLLGTISLTALVAIMLAPTAAGSGTRQQACNLRGSWIADTGETERYVRSGFNPGGVLTDLRVKRGSLSATFAGGTFTLGGLSIKIVGDSPKPDLKIEEIVDLETVARYRVTGRRIVLSPGTYKVRIVRASIVTPQGSKPFPAPSMTRPTTATTMPYTCTPGVLRLKVRAGRTVLDMKFDRER